MVEAERQAAGFRVGEVVTTDAGIEPFHAVEDQAVDRVAGGKSQAAEDVVIQQGEGIGVIFHGGSTGQHFQRLIRMLAKRRTDKDGGDIGTH